MRGFKALRIILAGLLVFGIFAMTGCKDDMPEYEGIVQALDNYRANYASFRKDHDDEMVSNNMDSTILIDGTPCKSYYLKSFDGKFCSVTLEYTRDNQMMIDEYFYLTDRAFFVVNSYLDEASSTPHILTYYVWDGKMYSIDEESKSLKAVGEDVSSKFYLSFEDLAKQYGPQER